MTEFYGVDWIAMMLTLTAIYMLGNKSRGGFITMMGGNTCWVLLGVLTGSLGLIAANIVFLIMNLRGFVKWGKNDS